MKFLRPALLLFLTLSAAAAQTPSITISPSAGEPTSTTVVGGAGFAAFDQVHISFAHVEEAVTTTDASGAFSGVTIPVPKSAPPGPTVIEADSVRVVEGAFTYFNVRTNWNQFHQGALHHGYNWLENVLNASNVGRMTLRWGASTGGEIASSSPDG